MAAIFVDTAYLIALYSRRDQWREAAIDAGRRLGDADLVTTDEVLTEFLTAMSGRGPTFRERAANMVSAMLESDSARVVEQSHRSFLDGLALYGKRPDKGYSLPDCVSMNVMEAEEITEILTSDRNFEQEGFTILMRSSR